MSSMSRRISARSLLVVVGLVAIVVLGFELRMGAALRTEVLAPLRADAGQYFSYAYNLRQHGTYSMDVSGLQPGGEPIPDAYRSPGYPLFLLPFVVDPPTTGALLNIVVAQAVLGTVLILAGYLYARSFLSEWAALGVAALTAVSPHLVNTGVYVLSETLFSLLVGMLFVVLLLAARNPSLRRYWIVVGMLLGAAALTRPTLQYFVVPLTLMAAYCVRSVSRRMVLVALLVGFTVVMAPWLIRNQLTLGVFGDDALKVATLQHGMYPDFMYRGDPLTRGAPYRADPMSPEITGKMDAVLKEIYRRFTQEPLRHLKWYLLGKPVALWSWDIVQGMGDAFVYPVSRTPYLNEPLFRLSHDVMRGIHPFLTVLAALGCTLAWLPSVSARLSPEGRFMVRTTSLFLIYFTAVHMVGAPFPRYSVPVRPFLYAMALFGAYRGVGMVIELASLRRIARN